MTQLTEAEWKRVLPLLGNFKPERRQAAHNRLVKGWTLAKSGALYGYSRQDVNIIVNAVLRKHGQLNEMPDEPAIPAGWMRIQFLVPRSRVSEVRRVVEALCPQPQLAKRVTRKGGRR